MPKGRSNTNQLNASAGFSQYKRLGSSISPQQYRRALQALPGRILQKEEAELLQCVTEAPAEPLIGAIHSGPLSFQSEGFSPQYLEFDSEISRVVGMGQLPDGFSRSSSSSLNPLRNNTLESPPLSAPSPSGDIPIKRHFTLANSGTDPTTNVLSGVEWAERQERTNEPTHESDTIKSHFIDSSVLNVCRTIHLHLQIKHTHFLMYPHHHLLYLPILTFCPQSDRL